MAGKGKPITFSSLYLSEPFVKCGYEYRYISNHSCPQCTRNSFVKAGQNTVTPLDIDRRRFDIEEKKIEQGYSLNDLMR